MRRRLFRLLILVSVLSATVASAAVPPPPFRYGGTWAASHPCSSPMPAWMIATLCRPGRFDAGTG